MLIVGPKNEGKEELQRRREKGFFGKFRSPAEKGEVGGVFESLIEKKKSTIIAKNLNLTINFTRNCSLNRLIYEEIHLGVKMDKWGLKIRLEMSRN